MTVAGARRELSWCRLDLAGDALGVAGGPQRPRWTSLRHRRRRSGSGWALAEAALGVAEASQGPLWASLGLAGSFLGVAGVSQGPLLTCLGLRRGRSGRRWGLAEAALGVAGVSQETLWVPRGLEEAALGVAEASQETLWASRGPQECLTSIQRSIKLRCLFWVSMLPSLQCFILVSMLSFTSQACLAGPLIGPSQSMREVEICLYPPGLDRFGARIDGVRWKSVPGRRHSRMWCQHVIGRDGWEWGDQGAYYEVIPPTRWGKNPSLRFVYWRV